MNIPCPNKISNCDCSDSPLANLSSEAPDINVIRVTGYAKPIPPLGTAFGALSCSTVASSTLSAQQAALLAQLEATLCATSTWTNPVNGNGGSAQAPVPPPESNRGGRSFANFFNTVQHGTAPCPNGQNYSFTVPAGLFFGRTQAQANEAALSYGNQQAMIHLLCLTDLPDQICQGAVANLQITASGSFVAAAPATNNWQISSGLPPGLTFSSGDVAGPATITGTPTTPGTYNFVVSVTLPNGDTTENEYFLTVAGITNGNSLPQATIAMSYNATLQSSGFNNPEFSISDEPLPDGLSMDSAGNITGTPASDAVTGTFTVFVRDSATDLSCSQQVTINVKQGGINFNNLVWDSPPDVNNPHHGGITFSNSGAFLTASLTGPGPANNPGPVFANSANMLYGGPSVSGNCRIVVSGGDFTDPDNGNNPVATWQVLLPDGTLQQAGQDAAHPVVAGTFNFPFTVTAGTLTVVASATARGGLITANGNINIAVTFMPEF